MFRKIMFVHRISSKKLLRAKQLRTAMTPSERLLWVRLRRNQFHKLHFRRQQIIAGYIVDFCCNEIGMVIELDGIIHETQKESDAYRDQVLQALGFRVMRVQNERVVAGMEDFLRDLEKEIGIKT